MDRDRQRQPQRPVRQQPPGAGRRNPGRPAGQHRQSGRPGADVRGGAPPVGGPAAPDDVDPDLQPVQRAGATQPTAARPALAGPAAPAADRRGPSAHASAERTAGAAPAVRPRAPVPDQRARAHPGQRAAACAADLPATVAERSAAPGRAPGGGARDRPRRRGSVEPRDIDDEDPAAGTAGGVGSRGGQDRPRQRQRHRHPRGAGLPPPRHPDPDRPRHRDPRQPKHQRHLRQRVAGRRRGAARG